MPTTVTEAEIRPLTIPASLSDADAHDFREMVEVRNRVYREVSGHDDHAMTAEALLPHFGPDPYQLRYFWVVVVNGRVVGRAGVDLPLEAGSRSAYWQVELLAEFHGRGIGSQAYELIERTAAGHGRTVLQSWAEHREAPGERLEAPTGFGSIPAGDRAARFYRRQGYTLEQIERCSVLDLQAPLDTAEGLLEKARLAATGYRVVGWFAPTPPEFVDDYAWLKSRMATDAPAAGLEFDEEAWDAARVALLDSRLTAGGRATRVAAAQHLESGRLVAFSELAIGANRSEASHQEDTLVLKEHRGHQLGTLVKCENLLAWRDFVPESPRVMTYNAEENRPMLDINEKIGFVPIAYEGAWKKVLHD